MKLSICVWGKAQKDLGALDILDSLWTLIRHRYISGKDVCVCLSGDGKCIFGGKACKPISLSPLPLLQPPISLFPRHCPLLLKKKKSSSYMRAKEMASFYAQMLITCL